MSARRAQSPKAKTLPASSGDRRPTDGNWPASVRLISRPISLRGSRICWRWSLRSRLRLPPRRSPLQVCRTMTVHRSSPVVPAVLAALGAGQARHAPGRRRRAAAICATVQDADGALWHSATLPSAAFEKMLDGRKLRGQSTARRGEDAGRHGAADLAGCASRCTMRGQRRALRRRHRTVPVGNGQAARAGDGMVPVAGHRLFARLARKPTTSSWRARPIRTARAAVSFAPEQGRPHRAPERPMRSAPNAQCAHRLLGIQRQGCVGWLLHPPRNPCSSTRRASDGPGPTRAALVLQRSEHGWSCGGGRVGWRAHDPDMARSIELHGAGGNKTVEFRRHQGEGARPAHHATGELPGIAEAGLHAYRRRNAPFTDRLDVDGDNIADLLWLSNVDGQGA